MTKCVVAYGNPFDGVQLVGPFQDADEAAEYAEIHLRDTDAWWTVGLEPTGGDTEVLLEGLPEATRKCRYSDCPDFVALATEDEQVSCPRCREYLGLPPI